MSAFSSRSLISEELPSGMKVSQFCGLLSSYSEAVKVRCTSSLLTSAWPSVLRLEGLPGSDPSSLMSIMLGLLPFASLLPLCWNCTPRLDFAIAIAFGAGPKRVTKQRATQLVRYSGDVPATEFGYDRGWIEVDL